jgi:sugar phosphate isomerase/epimerase
MKIGILIGYNKNTNIEEEFKRAVDMQLTCCQLCCWDNSLYTQENANTIKAAAKKTGMEITALWAGWSGPAEWNFYGGPDTLGLVPQAYRFQRLKELFEASDFTEMLGITDLITHAGFLPEYPFDPDFNGVVTALRKLALYMKEKGQYFLFETGQETPVTMLRAIEEIGTGNLGVNFDTANLILYGKANSVDALDTIGKYVRNTHFKDGNYPTCGRELGHEVALGEGKANVPAIVKKLKELGYTGPLVIEREISGDQQIKDIKRAQEILNGILETL